MGNKNLNILFNNKGQDVTKFSKARGYQCDKRFLILGEKSDPDDLSQRSYNAIYPCPGDEYYNKTIDGDGFIPGSRKCFLLKEGTIVIRYGPATGQFFAPPHTPYEQLSLPYKESENEFHVYKVVKEFCVERGTIAPWFGQPGGGIQYYSKMSAHELLNKKFLEEETDESTQYS